ncbi:MAG: hypothetical protein K9L68_07130 [Spirochaetales bacterium]|nr:hypothetical protein [Spirochaetales bacterium]
MFTFYFNVGFTYVLVGFIAALIVYYLLRKPIIGNFWGALIIGCIGSFFGGILYVLFDDFFLILTDINSVNIYPAIVAALLLLLVFSRSSRKKNSKE